MLTYQSYLGLEMSRLTLLPYPSIFIKVEERIAQVALGNWDLNSCFGFHPSVASCL